MTIMTSSLLVLMIAAGVPERDSLVAVSPSEVDSRDTATQVHSSVDLLCESIYPFDDMEIDEDLLDDDGMEDMFRLDLGIGGTLNSGATTRVQVLPLLPPLAGNAASLVRVYYSDKSSLFIVIIIIIIIIILFL